MKSIVLKGLFIACMMTIASVAHGQSYVSYTVRFPDYIQHKAEITAVFQEVPLGSPLELRMSRTSPGRYSLHEFAKNVYDVRAYGASGSQLEIERAGPHQWNVLRPESTVEVTYTLFADQADGTYSGIDRTHVHLNMPATFMWARGFDTVPIRLEFERPVDSWQIATQLFTTRDTDVFTAPNLMYFMDSPVELSAFSLRTWIAERDGKKYDIRLAVHHEGTDDELDVFAENLRRITQTQFDIFGGPPDYDNGTYTFIVDLLPHVYGDGMEHRNSTVVTSQSPLSPDGLSNLGTPAHEFFHQWNVERLRPRALEPFSFEEENQSGELWFAEGVTSYYTDLTIRRAGLMSDSDYAHALSEPVNTIVNAPGRNHFSAVGMSMEAPLADRFAPRDRENNENTFISYYTWGSGLGLALDLSLRDRFGATLDDLMRKMWDEFGRSERPYSLYDIERLLADVTDDTVFAKDFFDRFVRGKEAPDFWLLLEKAGFVVRARNAETAYMGGSFANTSSGAGGATLVAAPVENEPLYGAGMDVGDRLVLVNGNRVTGPAYVQAVLDLHEPGDSILLVYKQRGHMVEASVELIQDPAIDVAPFEDDGLVPTDQMLRFRRAWLGD